MSSAAWDGLNRGSGTNLKDVAMTKLTCEVSVSLDGFSAGPNQTLDEPLGQGGEGLHQWAFTAVSWRESHGLSGGEANADSEVIDESIRQTGATVMGRRMFSGGAGPWADDPNANGWWGDTPPFHHPVFVLTHHEREPLAKEGGTTFTFVTDGIESALDQARTAAGDEDVAVAGGADAVQQYLRAGLLDEIQLHVAPVLLGDGARLFDGQVPDPPYTLERTRVIESPTGVTHVTYRTGS
jgi:dihydrofolate reductase